MALLEVQGVNVVYEPSRGQRIWSVRDLDLSLEQGEFVGLVGESGCGKSTLGFALTRMLRPPARLESGVIRFDGVDISSLKGEELRRQRRNGFAIVLQSGMNALNPVRNVEHHFGDILRAHAQAGEHYTGATLRRRGAELLGKVGLDAAVLSRFPHELSGGMRQRVALARALAQDADVLLMDEPFGALDAMTRDLLHDELERICSERSLTVLFVTHNVREAVRLGDRVVLLSSRPGRVIQEYDVPRTGPRRIDSASVAKLASTITDRLRDEMRRHG
jgi:ABC-type glutathione transport system ATPase component